MAILTPPGDSQAEMRKLKLVYFSNEFPHDDLRDLFRSLHNHSKDRSHILLARFLVEATAAVREEVRLLPTQLRALVPAFTSILDFADHPDLRKGPLAGSVEGILLCVVELATFIGYYENCPEEYNADGVDTCLAGLGIGLLASSAISLSPTLADVPVAGAEVVRVAFRLGVLVDDVSQNLEPRDPTSSPDTWAYVVPDATADDVQKELDAIHAREKTPESSKIFISAPAQTSVTVSGPPSRLKRLFRNSDFFRDRKFIALPVYGGLCHAPHIYTEEHARRVVRTSAVDRLDTRYSPGSSLVLSTSTGRPYAAKSASHLLEQVVLELLTQQIKWDRVVQGLVQLARSLAAPECQVQVFRISLPVHDLVGSLNSELEGTETSTEELVPWIANSGKPGSSPREPMQSKIAIVGMSCRMPGGATNTEKFWELLEQGLDVHRKIPADRFNVDTHTDPTGKRVNTSITPYGCFIDEPALFDAPFFNMSPREAQETDPMQRLALVTAYEALERAGYVANRTSATDLHRIGTFYGQASDDYREVNTAQEIGTYFIPGGCRAFGPGRINYFFKFSGPSFNMDTACSSSLATIQAACTSLWAGDTDTVVAGGLNVLTNSDAFAGLSNGHFLSKTPNACKTWDCEADGYCRADAVGSIVMKRLEDAEADNDNILGVVLAAATNHSAEAVSITHPHAGAQSYLYREVMSRAGIDPLDVSFVEMHGTGTQAGDSVEMESITNVFAPITKRRSAKQPLHVGAVKSNVGHAEAGAGVTALLKTLLMFQKGAIPPHAGIKNSINPAFPKDLDKRNLHIPYEKQPWPRTPGKRRIAVVNNFSAAGGNTTVAIEEPPLREKRPATDPRGAHVIAVSAKSKLSLKGNLQRMVDYLDKAGIETDGDDVNDDDDDDEVSSFLSDLSYSTTARRYHHNYRVAVSASDTSHLKKQLATHLENVDSHKPIPPQTHGPPTVAFAFSGQGSSHKSMDLGLFHDHEGFRAQIMHLDSLAQAQGFPSFVPAIDGSHPKDHAHSPVVTQLALVCTEIALAKYWASLGVKPNAVIGHSLGEYAAMHVAGVLSASDAIFLVGKRAQLLEQKCQMGSHRMMAVRGSIAEIENSVGAQMPYQIACINGPKETVLTETREKIDALGEVLRADGFRCHTLDVPFAFHSEQTDPVLDDYEEIAHSGVLFQAPSIPVVSPLLGKVVFDSKTVNANYLRRATREPVNFLAALNAAQKLNTVDEKTVWVEIGPHPVAVSFVKATLPSVNVAAASLRRDEDCWSTIAQSLCSLHCAGVPVEWNEFHRPFESALRLLDLPTYSWNDKRYWIMYNGDWALTKGNTFYDAEKGINNSGAQGALALPKSSIMTSTVQQIIQEEFQGATGKVVMQSDLMHPDFLAAANGHHMNGCGVVTSSIHADIAFTLGEYLYKKLKPGTKKPEMNITNLEVLKGLVANKNTQSQQLIQVSAATNDVHSGIVDLRWYNVNSGDGSVDEPFASANIHYGDTSEWLTSWVPITHLIQSRIEDLERMAEDGTATRFSHKMAYRLFANNLVDYSQKYRGMQSVVLNGFEATANVVLTTEKGGVWTVPPFFIDSVAHLAGFIMNVSDSVDTKKNFCVTPGWSSMRFARPLVPGGKYRSYVKMIPTPEDATVFLGDVYILQQDGDSDDDDNSRLTVVGMVGGIKFRQYPRLLINRFFSPPDEGGASKPPVAAAAPPPPPPPVTAPTKSEPTSKPDKTVTTSAPAESSPASAPAPAAAPTATAAAPATGNDDGPSPASDGTDAKALALIAREAAISVADLVDDASFANLGIDSLMSLVIAEKFREELGIVVGGSLFLEYPTIGDLRAWLIEYHS